MTQYKIHWGGGMGDIFQGIHRSSNYPNLIHLNSEDKVDVLLICHNPFVLDFFKWHPKAGQLNVKCPGYWGPEHNEVRRKEGGFWRNEEENQIPGPGGPVVFYPSPEDVETLKQFEGKRIVVIQATAGCADRNIPVDQMDKMLKDLKDKDVVVVGIGRNYERGDRSPEFDYSEYPWVVSMVDKLSIPGTIQLIEQSVGVIACHSCVCLMAWRVRKPNILTLPRAINHINGIGRGEKNQWTYGLFYPETQLVYSEDYSIKVIDQLLKDAKIKPRITERINGIETRRLMNNEDAREYRRLVENIPDKSLIVEVGSFDGGSLISLMDLIKHKNLDVVVADKFDQPMTEDFNARGQMLGSKDSFKSNMAEAGIFPQAVLKDSDELAVWIKKNVRKPNLIFIDADHSYEGVKKDVDNLYSLLLEGGILAGHDYFPDEHPGIVKFVNERFPQAMVPGGTGIWSVRKSKGRYAVISMNDATYKPLADITWTGKEVYCKKHGYDAIFYPVGERTEESKQTEGHNHWFGFAKIQNILTTLETGKYNWVFFSECDALITNMDLPLDGMVDDDYHILLTSNFDGINAGNLFARNTDAAKNYLRFILKERPKYSKRGYAKQQCMMDIQEQNRFPGVVRIMPQRLWNSHDHFLYDHYKVPKERRKDILGLSGEWQPGDFQVHWSGFGLEKRLDFVKFYKDKIVNTVK